MKSPYPLGIEEFYNQHDYKDNYYIPRGYGDFIVLIIQDLELKNKN